MIVTKAVSGLIGGGGERTVDANPVGAAPVDGISIIHTVPATADPADIIPAEHEVTSMSTNPVS